jgi:hypothetical protein
MPPAPSDTQKKMSRMMIAPRPIKSSSGVDMWTLSTIPHDVHGHPVNDGDWLAIERSMKERSLTIPEIALIGGTRVALGVGIGLLISDRLNKDQRKGAGWALFGVGVLTTIPIVVGIVGKRPIAEKPVEPSPE